MIMKSKFAYVGIRVKDLQKSTDFYTELLDMKVQGRGKVEPTKGETVGLVSAEGGFVLELNYYGKDSLFNTEYVVGEGLDHLAFKVDNLDNALEEARKAGYRTVLEMQADGGRWAYIEDPNGIWIELFQ
jgi:catechol 2,3-dioxygenase-like lactoylglutathione lyase family enzyme